MELSKQQRESLLEAARKALQHAYAPYSKFRVGAAILTEQDEIFTGCNVENASYGLTICAERSAIFTAVAQTKASKLEIRAVAVVNGDELACSPCGACRQVIFEFADADTPVVSDAADGSLVAWTAGELLPHAFKTLKQRKRR